MKATTEQFTNSKSIQGAAGVISAEESGEGGIPVLFAHSFGGSSIQWRNQLEHLSDSRRVVAFDFREHGRSDAPCDKDFSAAALAKDISAVVDDLQLSRFVLVGHSMGGAAAVAYAGSHPDRVAGLVLVGTPGKADPEQAKQIMGALKSEAYQKVMDQYMTLLLQDAKPEVNLSVSADFDKMSRETSIAITGAMFAYDPLPDLKKYTGPVLIISTSREDSQPNTLAFQRPDVEHKTIEGTSHWSQLDKPGEFNKILDEFLKKIK
jgi:pimeloyl-ACP methyl ester carboxylesterase